MNLASQVVMESEVAIPNAPMGADVSARPTLQFSLSEAAAWVREADNLSAASAEDGDCLIGFSVAIGLEAAMACGFYGIWRVWHLIW